MWTQSQTKHLNKLVIKYPLFSNSTLGTVDDGSRYEISIKALHM